jgi:hypothetical protein
VVDTLLHPFAATIWATCHGLVSLERKGVSPEPVVWSDRYDDTLWVLTDGLRQVGPR